SDIDQVRTEKSGKQIALLRPLSDDARLALTRMDILVGARDVDVATKHDFAALVVKALRPRGERLEEFQLGAVVLAAIRNIDGREHGVPELCLHDPAFHVEVGMAELRLGAEQRLAKMERHAGVGAATVPVHIVVGETAPCGYLSGLGLQLLQAHDVGLVALEPIAELSLARADAVDVPGGDLHETSKICYARTRAARTILLFLAPLDRAADRGVLYIRSTARASDFDHRVVKLARSRGIRRATRRVEAPTVGELQPGIEA